MIVFLLLSKFEFQMKIKSTALYKKGCQTNRLLVIKKYGEYGDIYHCSFDEI